MDEFLFFFYHDDGKGRALISTYSASLTIIKVRNEMSSLFADTLGGTVDVTGCTFLAQVRPDLRPLRAPFPCVDVIGVAPDRDRQITA
jgi:hypothetical protein